MNDSRGKVFHADPLDVTVEELLGVVVSVEQ
jgi:hypothetical protein